MSVFPHLSYSNYNNVDPRESIISLLDSTPNKYKPFFNERLSEINFASEIDKQTSENLKNILALDPENTERCTLLVHGTNSKFVEGLNALGKINRSEKTSDMQLSDSISDLYNDLETKLDYNVSCNKKLNPDNNYFSWLSYADASPDARFRCALELSSFAKKNELQPLNLIAHSHGGNCSLLSTQNIYEIIPKFHWEKNKYIHPSYTTQNLDNGTGYISESTLVNFISDYLTFINNSTWKNDLTLPDSYERDSFDIVSTRHDPKLHLIIRRALHELEKTESFSVGDATKWKHPTFPETNRISLLAYSQVNLNSSLEYSDSFLSKFLARWENNKRPLHSSEKHKIELLYLEKQNEIQVKESSKKWIKKTLENYCQNSNQENIHYLESVCHKKVQHLNVLLDKLSQHITDLRLGLHLKSSGITVNHILTLNTPPFLGSIPSHKFSKKKFRTYVKNDNAESFDYFNLTHHTMGNTYEPNWDRINGIYIYLQPDKQEDAVVSSSIFTESNPLFKWLGLSSYTKPEQSIIGYPNPSAQRRKKMWDRFKNGQKGARDVLFRENATKIELSFLALELPPFLLNGYEYKKESGSSKVIRIFPDYSVLDNEKSKADEPLLYRIANKVSTWLAYGNTPLKLFGLNKYIIRHFQAIDSKEGRQFTYQSIFYWVDQETPTPLIAE